MRCACFLPLAAALAFGATTLLAPRSARAGGFDDTIAVAGTVFVAGVAVLGADIVYSARDIGTAGRNLEPSENFAVAQTVVTAPQALLITGLVGFMASERDTDDGMLDAIILPATWLNTLATYGTWTLGSRDVGSSARFGLSVPIGANIALTSYALGRLSRGGPIDYGQSAVMISLTLPQVVLGTVQLARGAEHPGGWVALTAHSGALLAYGIANIAWRASSARSSPPEALGRGRGKAQAKGFIGAAPTMIGEGGAGMMVFGTW